MQTQSFYLVSDPPEPIDLEVILQPAAGQSSTDALAWDVCVRSDTDARMRRVSIGLHVEDSTYGTMRILGCDGPEDPEGRRECDDSINPRVDPEKSFTMGPFPTNSPPYGAETLYLTVEGNVPFFGSKTLNPQPAQESCIATVAIDPPVGTPGDPPGLVTDGTEGLPFPTSTSPPVPAEPFVLTLGSTPLTLEEIVLSEQFDQGEDYDNDTHRDSADNCRFTSNYDLANRGGFMISSPELDNIGDACECADANGSGASFGSETPDPDMSATPDLDLIRDYLVGKAVPDEVAELCSVVGSVACDTVDAVALQRAFGGANAPVEPSCDAYWPD